MEGPSTTAPAPAAEPAVGGSGVDHRRDAGHAEDAAGEAPAGRRDGAPHGGDAHAGRGAQDRPRPADAARPPGRGGRKGKNKDMGRVEWSKQKLDKRKRNDDEQTVKRQRLERGEDPLPIYATKFSEEQLADEERRPKKKVAVLIGYAGSGYHGMQLTHDLKTIEGDLFKAFVDAGAISKANADDPKKSSFVRCARTDKGVHAAGNVISLKLIVEEDDIVAKINEHLPAQIRMWGFERTTNAFSAYQNVDSRIYEYLIPSHSFLPPHPSSVLGMKCDEFARATGDWDEYQKRQEEVVGYWDAIDEAIIKPILDEYDEETKAILKKALYAKAEEEASAPAEAVAEEEASEASAPKPFNKERAIFINDATRRLRQAYIKSKRAWRIPEQRLERIQQTLNYFVGTRNFHNFTVDKVYRDPSAKRLIKSFKLNFTPVIIDGSEWLSMKVHGQSFMMHQIRKMVGMVALVVRCGCSPSRMSESFGDERISIPKAPSLGLLLERPVFDTYNQRATKQLARPAIDFDKFKAEMDKFKQEQIYERMYRDEEKDNVFGNFFNHVDNFPSETFLFVTSGGIAATRAKTDGTKTETPNELVDDEGEQAKDEFGAEG